MRCAEQEDSGKNDVWPVSSFCSLHVNSLRDNHVPRWLMSQTAQTLREKLYRLSNMAFRKKRAKRSQNSSRDSIGRKKPRTSAFATRTPKCGRRFPRHPWICTTVACSLPQAGCVREYGDPVTQLWYPMEMANRIDSVLPREKAVCLRKNSSMKQA